MSSPALLHVDVPFAGSDAASALRMAYWQWGEAHSPHVVLCVHGLTRQGRDFDVLARALLDHARSLGRSLRVLCPDVVGRGHSAWLPDPAQYQPLTYVAHMQALLRQAHAQAPVQTFDWVGTSMGGVIGMLGAVQAETWPVPVRRLVLNDIGPALQWSGLERIRGYVGQVGPIPSLAQGLGLLRAAMASFGPHTDAQWLALNTPMFRPAPGSPPEASAGPVVLHYDPAIAQPLKALTAQAHESSTEFMRSLYEQIRCQTLLLRGAESDLLSADSARAMTQTGPRARLLEFAGVGHAPTLIAEDQVQAVRDFLFQS